MSRDRMFMVAVDVLDPSLDLRSLKEFLRTTPEIRAWWNHIPGCFLMATDWDADRLTDEVRKASHEARLLVMQVEPSTSEGWLPEQSWQWIRRRATQEAR